VKSFNLILTAYYWQRCIPQVLATGEYNVRFLSPILNTIASRNDPSSIDAEKQIICHPASVPYGPTTKPVVITEISSSVQATMIEWRGMTEQATASIPAIWFTSKNSVNLFNP
jgi:hypothetical protein